MTPIRFQFHESYRSQSAKHTFSGVTGSPRTGTDAEMQKAPRLTYRRSFSRCALIHPASNAANTPVRTPQLSITMSLNSQLLPGTND